jgi:hypothetical protein
MASRACQSTLNHRRIFRVGILELRNRTSLEGVTIKFIFIKFIFANELQNQLRKLFTLPYVKAAQAKAELLTGAFKRSAYCPLLLLRLADLVGVHRVLSRPLRQRTNA